MDFWDHKESSKFKVQKPKPSTTKKRRITPVVIGILRRGNKYLLTKRVQNGEWVHKKWQFPGGELEFGESSEKGLQRELREELGIRLGAFNHKPLVYDSIRDNWHGILIVYLYELKDYEKLVVRLNHESSEFGWFTLDEIMKLDTLPKVKDMAQDAGHA